MKRNVKLLSISGGVLIMASLSLIMWSWAQESAIGTVSIGTHTTTPSSNSNIPSAVSTPYFSTKLSAGFTVKRQAEKPTQAILFTLTASKTTPIDEQFSTTIGTLPTGGIQELGDYILRTAEPATYERVDIASLPMGTVAFRNSSSPLELTIFWPHQTNYAEVSCSSSGGATSTELETVCKNVLDTWTWNSASR